MNIVIADNGAPRNLKSVQCSPNDRVSGVTAVVSDVPRKKRKADRASKAGVELRNNGAKIVMVLLAFERHVQISDVCPGDNPCGVWLSRPKRRCGKQIVHEEASSEEVR